MGVITIQQLGDYLGLDLTEDKKAKLIVDAVNDWVEAYTGRVFGEIREVLAKLDYEPVVFLPHIDITEISEVKIGETVVTGYRWNDTGRVVLSKSGRTISGQRSRYDMVAVRYKTGTTAALVPSAVTMAALQLAGNNFNQQGTEQVSQASVGGYSLSFGGGSGGSNGTGSAEPNSYAAILNAYRVRKV